MRNHTLQMWQRSEANEAGEGDATGSAKDVKEIDASFKESVNNQLRALVKLEDNANEVVLYDENNQAQI